MTEQTTYQQEEQRQWAIGNPMPFLWNYSNIPVHKLNNNKNNRYRNCSKHHPGKKTLEKY